MTEWINPYLNLSPRERHGVLVRYFWSMPNRETVYESSSDANIDDRNFVSALNRDWKRRKVSEFRFEALENIALLLQLSPGTIPFRVWVYQQFDFLTIHGIIRDEQASKDALIDFFGPNRGIQEHHSSPIFPICDLGNPDTEGIFGEQTVKVYEQKAYQYELENDLFIRRLAEEKYGPGSYEKLKGVVNLDLKGQRQEWYREFVTSYQDTP